MQQMQINIVIYEEIVIAIYEKIILNYSPVDFCIGIQPYGTKCYG